MPLCLVLVKAVQIHNLFSRNDSTKEQFRCSCIISTFAFAKKLTLMTLYSTSTAKIKPQHVTSTSTDMEQPEGTDST